MSGGAIAYNDYVQDAAEVKLAPGGPAYIGNLSSLQTPQLSDCVTFEAGTAVLSAEWGDARDVGLTSLLDVRFVGTFQIISMDLKLSGSWVPFAGTAYPGYPSVFVKHLHQLVASSFQFTGVRYTLDSDSGFSLGRFWCSDMYFAPDQIEQDWVPRVLSAGSAARSKGQQGYTAPRQCVRGLRMRFGHSDIATVIGTAGSTAMDPHQLAFVLDKQPVIAFPRTGSGDSALQHLMHRFGVYGISTRDQYEFPHRGGDRYDVEFDFLETL